MRQFIVRLGLTLVVLQVSAAAARADVCFAIDEAHDTLSPGERTAAILLLGKQFELAGERVAPPGCTSLYTLAHIVLGNTITVTLSGPRGTRDGTALGIDDLPALYNQMARSIVSGRPMSGFNVVDRTNVTALQASGQRVQADSVWYTRLGYGGVAGDKFYGGPAMGFGYRLELDSFGIDVSFLNFQMRESNVYSYYSGYDGAFSGSAIKLEGLYFLNPRSNRSTYVGGGFSWGGTDFGSSWHGDGLQAELTAGHELFRASTLRAFLQADATLPFYDATRVRFPTDPRRAGPLTVESRYAPSVVVSIGLGWGRNHRRH